RPPGLATGRPLRALGAEPVASMPRDESVRRLLPGLPALRYRPPRRDPAPPRRTPSPGPTRGRRVRDMPWPWLRTVAPRRRTHYLRNALGTAAAVGLGLWRPSVGTVGDAMITSSPRNTVNAFTHRLLPYDGADRFLDG